MASKPTDEELKQKIEKLEKEASELKQTIESLRGSENKFHAFFGNSLDALFITMPDGRILEANPAACRMFDYTEEELIQGGRNLVVDLDDPRLPPALKERRRTGKFIGELTFKRKDGTKFPAEISSVIFKSREGDERVSIIIRDIQRRKAAELALRESEERFRFLTETVSDIIWTVDLNLSTTYVSPSIERVLGFTPEERKRQQVEEVLTPESLKLIQVLFAEELAKEKDKSVDPDRSMTNEVEYYRKDRTTVWLENAMKWIRDEKGAVIGIHGVSRDISKRKKAQIERDKLHAQLIQGQKMESVGRLAGGVAHDFNNMLGVILGRVEMILMGMKPGDSSFEDLEEIQKAARRSADLTRQLLAFARRQAIAPKVLDLNDVVEGMLKMLRHLIGEDIDLIWHPDTRLWPVKMDPAQLDQILANLCMNAKDAIAGSGTVTIETENVIFDDVYCEKHAGSKPGRYVLLAVSDDGCGMDKEIQSHLFEPFFTTKEVGKGAGLGLATIYGIVKQNDGYVDFQSDRGQGTTFRIYIPRNEGDFVKEAAAGSTEKPRGRGETILLVEDEPGILAMGKAMLERLGYAVFSTSDPYDALDLVKEHPGKFHLLMTDVVMPKMSGKDLAEQVKVLNPKIKILFMSGYNADVIVNHGVIDSGTRFIQKPFSMKDLSAAMQQALG